MNNKLTFLLISITLLVAPIIIFAGGFDPAATPEPTNRASAINFVGFITSILDLVWLVLLAAVIILVIVTAFLFLTTQGDPEKIKKARMALLFAIIGIIVALLGYRMVATISGLLGSGTSSTTTTTPPPTTAASGACCEDTGNNPGLEQMSCSIKVQADCNQAGGIYRGDGTTCNPNLCPGG